MEAPVSYLWKGLLIGLLFGIPAGAIGALSIQRTIARGFRSGFLTGLGCSAADLLYACACAFGVTVIANFLSEHERMLRVVGGAFILCMGAASFRKPGTQVQKEENTQRLLLDFSSSFVIAMTNPATLLSFFAAFTAFDITGTLTKSEGACLVVGIALGTMIWWLILAGTVAAFRRRITLNVHIVMRYALGVLLMTFGLVTIFR